jgi:PAS domain S-box-containing protein
VAALDALEDGLLVVDRDFVIAHLNRRAAAALEHPREELLGRELFQACPPLADSPQEALYRRAMRDRVPGSIEVEGVMRERWFRISAHPVPGGLAITWTDISERVRAERARVESRQMHAVELERSESRYRMLFEHLSEGFALHEIVLDEAGRPVDYRFLEVNAAFERLTGLGRENVLGRSVREVIPDIEPTWIERYGEVALTGRPDTFVQRSEGLGRDYEVLAFQPRPGQFGALFLDVTERRRAEEAVLRAHERLVEQDRRKTEFLAVLSHELRNPLAPIRNALQVLDRAEPGTERAARAKATMDRQVAQLSNLVSDLLDVTRITSGKVRLAPVRLDLGEVVRRAVDDHRAVFEAAGVALDVAVDGAPVYVVADRTRVAQVVGNLLQNAAKFTPAGRRAAVSLRVDHGEAVLSIADEGVGMTNDVIARVFEPFAQAEQTLDRSKGGLGLGLALVKGLVELSGGRVAARSDGPDRGTEITVLFPLAATTEGGP